MSEGTRVGYPSDMSDAQWEQLAPLIPAKVGTGKNRTVNLREVMNATTCRVKTLCIFCEPVASGNICRVPQKQKTAAERHRLLLLRQVVEGWNAQHHAGVAP
jgi:hypothetical protein